MEKNKNFTQNFIVTLLFFISPFFSVFPVIGLIICKRKKLYFLFLLTLILSLVAFIFYTWNNDTADLNRRYEIYEYYKNFSFNDLKLITKNKFDFLYDYFVWTLGYFNLSKQWLAFVGIFLYYYGQFLILNFYYEKFKLKNIDFILAFLIVLTSLLVSFISQIRGPIAAGFLFIGYYFYIQKRYFIFNLLGIIGSLMHFSMLPIFIILNINLILIKIRVWTKLKKFFLLASLVISIFLDKILLFIVSLSILPAYFVVNINSYLMGYWSGRSSNSIPTEIMNILYLIIFVFILFQKKKIKYLKEESLIILMLIFILLNIISKTNLMRYAWYTQGILLGYLLLEINNIKNEYMKWFIRLYLIGLIVGRVLVPYLFESYFFTQTVECLLNENALIKNLYQIIQIDIDRARLF